MVINRENISINNQKLHIYNYYYNYIIIRRQYSNNAYKQISSNCTSSDIFVLLQQANNLQPEMQHVS